MKIKRKARESKSKKAGDYVDNEKFLIEISEYRKKYYSWKENPDGKERPQLSNYLGNCFLKIAEGQSKRPSFYNYPFKEEMVSDGYYDCVKYAYVFNPEKTNNPFAYFSQVCLYAFLRRIKREKKNYYILCKAIANAEIFNLLSESQEDAEDLAMIDDIGYSKEARLNMAKFVEDYETAKDKKKKSAKVADIELDFSDELTEEDDSINIELGYSRIGLKNV